MMDAKTTSPVVRRDNIMSEMEVTPWEIKSGEVIKIKINGVVFERINEKATKNHSQKTKVCTHCGIEKPSDEFCKDRKNKDGLQCWCKDCTRKQLKSSKEKNKILLDKGETLAIVENRKHSIFENPLKEIFSKIVDGKEHSTKEVHKILAKYYENKTTISHLTSSYLKYIKTTYNKEYISSRGRNAKFCFKDKQKPDVYMDNLKTSADRKISNGSSPDSLPLVDSGTKDRKTIFNWKYFKIGREE